MSTPEGFLIFATEQGGFFKAFRATREEYERARKTGYLEIFESTSYLNDEAMIQVGPLAFVGWGPLEESHDFGALSGR